MGYHKNPGSCWSLIAGLIELLAGIYITSVGKFQLSRLWSIEPKSFRGAGGKAKLILFVGKTVGFIGF